MHGRQQDRLDGKPSPKNFFIEPSAQQMLRVLVGLGLKRGKLDAVYAALRGRVPTTGVIDPARREAGFEKLKKARTASLNINRWHHFLSGLPLAGYRSKRMITSELTLIYAYAIYLIGVEEVGVDLQVIAAGECRVLLHGRHDVEICAVG